MLRPFAAACVAAIFAGLTLATTLVAQEPQPNADWKPAAGKLMTKWAAEVSPENALPEYPRPQLVRDRWQNLNGLWDYRIEKAFAGPSEEVDSRRPLSGKILVPFPLESALSGVGGKLLPDEKLIYERQIAAPQDWATDGGRVRIHFGAVDWKCEVFLDDQSLGIHGGGYDPFWFDVPAERLVGTKPHTLRVEVWDPSDAGYQPVGKQTLNPHGIWYTAVSGIWQTVWMEPLPTTSIDSLDVTTVPAADAAGAWTVEIGPNVSGSVAEGTPVELEFKTTALLKGDERQPIEPRVASAKQGSNVRLTIDDPKLWSPEEPWLYEAEASLVTYTGGDRSTRVVHDTTTTYFGLRQIATGVAEDGHRRIFLNGEPLFQFGPLDQGWWPDGLYTAPTDEALAYDVVMTKKLGFNMARKHVKVEPARWYWHCDRLGLLVWQDMPSGDTRINPDQPDVNRNAQSELAYRREWSRIVEALDSHPCIVVWVPFNEGWGQFKTNEILAWTKALDPTRLVDGPSGWADRGEGDLMDMHRYPGPGKPDPQAPRVAVLGEFGGLGLPVEGHLWVDKNNWGYRTYKTPEELEQNYRRLIQDLRPLIAEGLAAAVYTQTTDVEIEVNGLMTYDRAVTKLPESIAELHATLYQDPPKISTVLPTSEKEPRTWTYSTDENAPAGWQTSQASGDWKQGPGGFGTAETPNSVVRTTWDGPLIRLRQEFDLAELPEGRIALRMFHDEDATVWLNGKKILEVGDYTAGYQTFATDVQAKEALKQGANVIAIECRQTRGGQFIDAGILTIEEE